MGELTYIVAEPKIGKSWWCLQDALATATDHNTPTFYWCGEMRRNQIMKRFYQLLGVSGRNMKSGNMTADDWQMFLAWMPIAPEDLVLVLGADFISGDDGRLVLALPRWHRQALSTESEERLLMMLAPLGIEQLEIRGEVKGD